MTKLDTGWTISEPVRPRIETAAAGEGMLTSRQLYEERRAWEYENRRAWEHVIDRQLIEWGKDPGRLECDDLRAPTAASIQTACEIAGFMRDEAEPPPLRVIPDGEGGIVFERAEGRAFVTVEIDEDGSVEICRFVDSRLQFRERVR